MYVMVVGVWGEWCGGLVECVFSSRGRHWSASTVSWGRGFVWGRGVGVLVCWCDGVLVCWCGGVLVCWCAVVYTHLTVSA